MKNHQSFKNKILFGLSCSAALSMAMMTNPELAASAAEAEEDFDEMNQVELLTEEENTAEENTAEETSTADEEIITEETLTVVESETEEDLEIVEEIDEEPTEPEVVEETVKDEAVKPEKETPKETKKAETKPPKKAETVAKEEAKTTKKETAKATETVNLDDSTIYMTEKSKVTHTVNIGDANPDNITWTLGGKSLDSWKVFDTKKGQYTDNFVKITSTKKDGDNLLITFDFGMLFGEDISLRTVPILDDNGKRTGSLNIRKTYEKFMGEHLLEGISADDSLKISKTLNLRPYEAFKTYKESMDKVNEVAEKAKEKTDRIVKVEKFGETQKYKLPMKMGIIAKDQSSIDRYLNEQTPLMLTNPDKLLELIKNKDFDYKIPVMFHNTHADEQPAPDIVVSLFEKFSLQDMISYEVTDKNGNVSTIEYNMSDILDRLILLFSFTENPDGRIDNTRVYPNGFDPNRDGSYQTNQETRALMEQINKWNPVSLIDFHGFVKEFLIEPATPPHDPNFEYDLFGKNQLEHAHAMGQAGISNSKYDSYLIPKIDYEDGWDDAFSGYTGVYAIYQGIMGHTVEVPQGNQDSFNAGYFAGLGSIDYVMTNLDKLMESKLTFFSRGINKIETPEAEKDLVGPDGEIVGRPEFGPNGEFFPDYFVISMQTGKDNATDAAYAMIDYLKRNGVIVSQLTKDKGKYKAGDLVVDMAQAKRGYANHVLFPGTDESAWEAMYAELVVNFPVMRGFKSEALYDQDGYFTDLLGEVTHTQAPRTEKVDTSAPYYYVSNNSVSAVQAINKAIAAGEKVYLTKNGFVVNTKTFQKLLKDYPLYGEALDKKPVGDSLKGHKVYSPNSFEGWVGQELPSEASIAMKDLGFEFVSSVEEADVIILDHGQFDASILGLKPTIIVGGEAQERLEELGVLNGFNSTMIGWGTYEGLFDATINTDNALANGYFPLDSFYTSSGSYIESLPEGFEELIMIAEAEGFNSGWFPGYEEMYGKTVAADGMYGDHPLFIFSGNPMNRRHAQYFYRWISNAIFRGEFVSFEDIDEGEDTTPETPDTPDKGEDKEDTSDKEKIEETEKSETEEMEKGKEQYILDSSGKKTATVKEKADLKTVDKAGVLPQTGENDGQTSFTLGTILVALGGYLFKFKRKEEEIK